MVSPVGSGFSIGPLLGSSSSAAGTSSSGGFAQALAKSLDSVNNAEAQVNQQAQSVATGSSTDLSSVMIAVEQATLEVSLASQVQTKAVEAYQSLFQTTV